MKQLQQSENKTNVHISLSWLQRNTQTLWAALLVQEDEGDWSLGYGKL